MAAGLSIARRDGGEDYPVIRIMPNTPASVGAGVDPVLLRQCDTAEEEQEFEADGSRRAADAVPEALIDAASSVSGCGPGLGVPVH